VGFPVPTFNVPVNLWRAATVIAGTLPLPPPDLTFNANLAMAKGRSFANFFIEAGGTFRPIEYTQLLSPKLTDIRGHIGNAWDGDVVEVPAASGRFYFVAWVEDVAKGFANEYRLANLLQPSSLIITLTGHPWSIFLWPVPTP